MDLWIRSQDKEVLLKCNQVYYFEINDKHIIATDLELIQRSYDYQPLGFYSSKERALEVLDEIQKQLEPEYFYDENGYPIKNDNSNVIYQMPEE